jgi:hypothetical protein
MRSYDAQDIISLPPLSATGAVALGQGLLTAGKAQTKLPELVSTRLSALELAHTAVSQAVSKKPQQPTDPQRTRSADQQEDRAWGAFHDWLHGWTRLQHPDADQARAMYAVLFPTRLKFTQLPYQLEWAEAETRLNRIASDNLDPEIEKLGGKLLIQQVRDSHAAYGEALGITAEGQDPNNIAIREPLQAFTNALRAYVLAVAAHPDPNDPTSVSVTNAMLAPLQRWQSYISVAAAPAPTSPTSPVTTSPTQNPPAHNSPAANPATSNGPGAT